MPASAVVYSIFLASPSDVSVEREVVARSISEWNNKNGKFIGVYYDLIRWENSIAAGIGVDGQDVINQQLPEYDILIGMFWKRIGSPTSRSISGTVEEYESAIVRKSAGQDVDIAIYFKQEPFIPDHKEIDQLSALYEFKIRTRKDGVLSYDFNDSDVLKIQIDLLLDKVSRKSINTNLAVVREKDSSEIKIIADGGSSNAGVVLGDDEEELGFFDFLEKINEASAKSTKFIEKNSQNLTHLSEITDVHTNKLNELSGDDIASRKKIFIDISKEMNSFSDDLDDGLIEFSEDSEGMIKYVRGFIMVSYDFIGAEDFDKSQLVYFRDSLSQMVDSMSTSNGSMRSLIETVRSSPRTVAEMNKARKKFIASLENYVSAVGRIRTSASEAISEMDSLIGRCK